MAADALNTILLSEDALKDEEGEKDEVKIIREPSTSVGSSTTISPDLSVAGCRALQNRSKTEHFDQEAQASQ
jgi:hypothetical protein